MDNVIGFERPAKAEPLAASGQSRVREPRFIDNLSDMYRLMAGGAVSEGAIVSAKLRHMLETRSHHRFPRPIARVPLHINRGTIRIRKRPG